MLQAILNCLVNPAARFELTSNNESTCSDFTFPVKSWLEATGKPTDGSDTNLSLTYRNQFRSIVDKGISQGSGHRKSGYIYQQGIRGQDVRVFDPAQLVIARVGSNAKTALPVHSGPYEDSALERAFYEIAAYFMRRQK